MSRVAVREVIHHFITTVMLLLFILLSPDFIPLVNQMAVGLGTFTGFLVQLTPYVLLSWILYRYYSVRRDMNALRRRRRRGM